VPLSVDNSTLRLSRSGPCSGGGPQSTSAPRRVLHTPLSGDTRMTTVTLTADEFAVLRELARIWKDAR